MTTNKAIHTGKYCVLYKLWNGKILKISFGKILYLSKSNNCSPTMSRGGYPTTSVLWFRSRWIPGRKEPWYAWQTVSRAPYSLQYEGHKKQMNLPVLGIHDWYPSNKNSVSRRTTLTTIVRIDLKWQWHLLFPDISDESYIYISFRSIICPKSKRMILSEISGHVKDVSRPLWAI